MAEDTELLQKSLLEYLQKSQQVFLLENGALVRSGGAVTDSDGTTMVLDAIYRVLSFGLVKGVHVWRVLESLQTIRPAEKDAIVNLTRSPSLSDEKRALSWIRMALNRKVLSDWITDLANAPTISAFYTTQCVISQKDDLSIFLDLIAPLRTVNFSLASLDDIPEDASPSKGGETADYIAEISKNLSPQKPVVNPRRVWGRGSIDTTSNSTTNGKSDDPASPSSRRKPSVRRVAVIGDLPDVPVAPSRESELNWEEIGNDVARRSPNNLNTDA